MKTIIRIIAVAVICASAAHAATAFDDSAIRRSNEQIRKSIERSNKQRELNSVESEMNRLRSSKQPSQTKDMQRYESRQQELQRDLNKR